MCPLEGCEAAGDCKGSFAAILREPKPGNNQPQAGRTASIREVGMETGADCRQPSGESAKAEGGERAASVSECVTSITPSEIIAECDLSRIGYSRGLHRASRVGIISTNAKEYFAAGYAFCGCVQDWTPKVSANRKAGAALLIGIAFGLLVSLAYQMVSRG
jgi:hypothetical protein